MKCGFCNHTDGLCYTSNPPQVKCNITGKYRFYGSDCDALVTTKLAPVECRTEYACVICGEGVPDAHGPAICEKCKEAVMKVRADMEKELQSSISRLVAGQIQIDDAQKVIDSLSDNYDPIGY